MNYTEKNKLIDQLCGVGLMLIFVEIFLTGVHEFYTNVFSTMTTTFLYIIGAIFLMISIFLYIYAYKKQNGRKAIYAIEFTVLAFICPFLVYLYIYAEAPFNYINPKIFWLIFLAYYIIKACYIIISTYKNTANKSSKKR